MRTSKIQNSHQGAPKWPTGSKRVFGHCLHLLLKKLLEPSTASMRKVDDRGEKKGEGVIKTKNKQKQWPLTLLRIDRLNAD